MVSIARAARHFLKKCQQWSQADVAVMKKEKNKYSCGQITLAYIILEEGMKFSFEIKNHEKLIIG